MNAKTVLSVLAVGALLAVGGVLYYLNRPAAEEASIANALSALEETPAATDPAGSETAPVDVTVDGVEGTWTVDTTIGTFDFADATSTFAGFRVDEVLSNVGETEAVGRTPAVDGMLTIEGTTLTEASVEADFTQLVSDIPRRDGAMKRAIGVEEFPTSTFTLTEPIDFGAVPEAGASTAFTAVGDLTVNGITHPIEFEMEASVADGNILVVGRAPVVFARYFITAPVAGPVVSVEDNGTIELQVWFTRS